ncbi:MAG: MBL fold metallo-hydrolase [Firmicutes bacterium]|jgi:glyoxylase-like metal-dependent hydrolase (beta-lactamase superfamily II)|nr:MBL fold metallo-hydrolase [Bacillota bacterium]
MKMTEIGKNIFHIEGNKAGRYPYANSLLIKDHRNVLIDSGIGREHVEVLAREYRIDHILVSHGHEDHTAGNDLFGADTKIAVHILDAPAVKSVDRLVELYNMPDEHQRTMMARFLREVFFLKDSTVDTEFTDGYTLDLGTIKVEAIHTPGHSAGHTCFFIPCAKIIFLGDIDLSSFGPWYGSLDADIDAFLDSIEKVKSIDFDTAVSSHKEIVYGKKNIDRKLDRYGEIFQEREEKLLAFLARDKTVEEIIDEAIIYGRYPEPTELYRSMEGTMICKHLRRLVDRGRIYQKEEGLFRAV